MSQLNTLLVSSHREATRRRCRSDAESADTGPTPFALSGRSLQFAAAALVTTTTSTIVLATLLATGGDFVGMANGREARTVHHYERQLADLKTRAQRAESGRLLEQERLRERVASLTTRNEAIADLGRLRTGSLTRSDGSGGISDPLADVESTLMSAEQRQLAELDALHAQTWDRAKRFAKVLGGYGLNVELPDTDTGGPLIQFKGSDPFSERMNALETALGELDRVRSIADRLPRGNPVRNRKISSRFGTRRDPLNGRTAMHGGLDYRAPKGDRVRATGSGKIVRAGRWGSYGKIVEVDHGNGLTSRYAHLSRISVKKGDVVGRGTIIGRVGSTGRSTGPHLHYEVRRNGQARDPMTYVELDRKLAPLM